MKRLGFLLSDGGRAASGRKGTAGDCVTRAASLLLGYRQGLDLTDQTSPAWGEVYDSTYRQLAAANKATVTVPKGGRRSARDGLHRAVYVPVFTGDFGFSKVKLPQGPRPTWRQAHHLYGNCVVSTAKHIAALVEGALCDLWDGRFYDWLDQDTGEVETRERKAMSVFALKGTTM